jgi:hypothetical protein
MDHARTHCSVVAPPKARLRRAVTLLVAGVTMLSVAPPVRAQAATEVRVERVRPKKDDHPTLQFLKENRDFIRGRLDLLREKTRARQGEAAAIDPRFLAYQDMLADIQAARESVVVANSRQQRLELFASITQLGDLETRLDLMERLLGEQRARLGVLQTDFTGEQRTSLMVVLSGYPAAAAPGEIGLTLDDRAALSVRLSAEQCASLQRGGSVEVFHGFVEPREQIIKVSVAGAGWPAGEAGYATLDPTRDRLTLLRLDLSGMDAGRGAPGIQASTWLHSAGTPFGDR